MSKDTESELASPTQGMEFVRVYKDSSEFLGLAWSGDGELLAAAGASGVVTIWTVTDGKSQAIAGHDISAWVRAVSWNPRSTALVSTSDDKTVRVWDRTARTSRQLCELEARGTGVAWSPGGERIAAIDDPAGSASGTAPTARR